MPTDEERQTYIDNWVSSMGDDIPTPGAQKFHKIMAKYDLDLEVLMTSSRTAIGAGPLDRKTKEFITLVAYTIRGFDHQHLVWHVKAALRAGATPEEILQALEMVLTLDGLIPFMRAVLAWAEATGAEGIEPTVPIGNPA